MVFLLFCKSEMRYVYLSKPLRFIAKSAYFLTRTFSYFVTNKSFWVPSYLLGSWTACLLKNLMHLRIWIHNTNKVCLFDFRNLGCVCCQGYWKYKFRGFGNNFRLWGQSNDFGKQYETHLLNKSVITLQKLDPTWYVLLDFHIWGLKPVKSIALLRFLRKYQVEI